MAFRPFFRGGRLVTQESITKEKAARMQQATSWTSVTSSNVRAIKWQPEDKDDDGKHGLGVWFHSGDQYWYPDAEFKIYEQMLAAPSKGRFLSQNVKGKFSHLGPFDS